MISLQRTGSNFLPYPQNIVNQHHNNYSTATLMEKHHQQNQLEDSLPWFARPVGPNGVTTTPGLINKATYASVNGIRDKEFISSSNHPISMTTNSGNPKNMVLCGGRLGGGSGSSDSTLSRSISPSSAEESFLNRSSNEENYYSLYPSSNQEQKIRTSHRIIKNVRDNELHLPEGKQLRPFLKFTIISLNYSISIFMRYQFY